MKLQFNEIDGKLVIECPEGSIGWAIKQMIDGKEVFVENADDGVFDKNDIFFAESLHLMDTGYVGYFLYSGYRDKDGKNLIGEVEDLFTIDLINPVFKIYGESENETN